MHYEDPFSSPGRWYKGCLHVHTTASDGSLSPEEALAWYQAHGYHFVAITDHNIPSEAGVLSEDWITLAGIEVGGTDPAGGLYHLVGLGLQLPMNIAEPADTMLAAIGRLRAVGALVVLAHPYWSGQRSADLMETADCFALEAYNGGCEVDDAKGYSHVHWDDLLAVGRRIWGLAVDDAHWRAGDRDAGLGWVWVKAPALTPQAVLEALEKGRFYSSSGPQIYELELDAKRGEITVHCSTVVAIDFVGCGPLSRRIAALEGETLTCARHRLLGAQGYVRVACRDARGRWAWSNPIFLDAAGHPEW